MAASNSLARPFLQNAQEGNLSLHREFADFIQEDGAALSKLEPAEAPLQRSGERSFLVTEQLRGDQRCWDGRTVDIDEDPGRALGSFVDGARDALFPRPRLSGYRA